jgi:hypothetical protein
MVTWLIKWVQNILLNFYQRLEHVYVVFFFAQDIIVYNDSDIFHLFMQHLEAVIRQKIPSIIAMINKTIDEIEAELDRLGRPIGGDAGVRILLFVL